jgi:hypothetical protein
MFDLNLIVFGYLFLRLAPFIIACFFTLASLLNADYKGVIYLAGLILSTVIVMMASPIFAATGWDMFKPLPDTMPICNAFSLVQDTSLLPQGQSMLAFTFAYLLYPIIKNSVVTMNLPTLIFFPVLMIFDFVWNVRNSCYKFGQLFASLMLGSGLGICWALVVSGGGKQMDSLYFTTGSPELVKCSKPNTSTFKCSVYKGGKLITNNMG